MATYSYSRLNTFETCPLRYKFKYIDRIKKDTLSIEQFLGICVHKAMEKLYRDIKMTKLNSLGDLTIFFNDFWEKNWREDIQNIKGQYTFDNYRKLGQRCIRDYYRRYAPFDHDRTLALEERVLFSLDEEGNYKMLGYIDRLSQSRDKEYNIHDYKTSATLPTQDKIDNDKQLALYQMAIHQRWPDVKNVRLIWHFMAFDKEMQAAHNDYELENLKKETIEIIKTVERTKEFIPRESQLCYWCDYAGLCPVKKHPHK
ncbi:MAG: PD-(D/E)XK nuclease family protein, partial [Candidatus Omnitrophota bacterium]|nr:PD-(D/E)XK nuclease family protein [Candidatus Omnitrophota bacterium]